MIASSISLGMHWVWTSYQGIQAVGQALGLYNSIMAPKVNIDGKHLSKGDAIPPNNGKLRLYNMRFCPYGQRTLLALAAKNIDFEVVNINLVEKPEWFESKSPLGGKVPSLEIKEGELVFESLITVEYLDEVYPQRPLLPKDPLKRAQDKIIIEVVNSCVLPLFFKLMKDHTNITPEIINGYHKGLRYVQDALKTRGTTFLDGEQPGYADYMIWVFFERLLAFDDDFVQITGPKYDLLSAYLKKMSEDPAVKFSYVPREIMQKFLQAFRTGRAGEHYEILHTQVI